jgi:hypothetical protein
VPSTARGCDHGGSTEHRQLHGDQADTAGATVDENGLTGDHVGRFEQMHRRGAHEHQTRSLLERQVRRLGHHIRGRRDQLFGVPAADAVGDHLIADRQWAGDPLGVRSDCRDNSGDLHAQRQRQLARIGTEAPAIELAVNGIGARCLDVDQDLARSGRSWIAIDDCENLGAAIRCSDNYLRHARQATG